MIYKFMRLVVFTLLLPGCSPNDVKEPTEDRAEHNIEDFSPFRFGMSFRDVIAVKPYRAFNPVGVIKCPELIPIKGCLLTQNTDSFGDVTVSGIPYSYAATFDQNDALYELSLHYQPQLAMTSEQCRTVIDKTIDWSWKGQAGRATLKNQEELPFRETPNGNHYPIPNKSSFAVIFWGPELNGIKLSYFASALPRSDGFQCRVQVIYGVETDVPHQFD